MKSLAFEAAGAARIRPARFLRRSHLPVGAACMVAAGMRETLSALLGAAVHVRLLEPAMPSAEAWMTIARGALMYRARGVASDAAIVLRAPDAAAVAAAAFGEAPQAAGAPRELSALERDVLDRVAAAIAPSLQSVCGTRDRDPLERVQTLTAFATYFEVLVEQPFDARIGIALSRDPAPETHGRLTLEDLSAVPLYPAVRIDVARLYAREFWRVASGDVVPMPPGAPPARLVVAGRTLARGACGVRGGKFAFAIGRLA